MFADIANALVVRFYRTDVIIQMISIRPSFFLIIPTTFTSLECGITIPLLVISNYPTKLILVLAVNACNFYQG